MSKLQGFADLDMIEQITLLDEIRGEANVDILSELLDVYATPLPDQAVDEMVYHALFEMMAGQPESIIKGLESDSERVVTLSIRRAYEDGDATVLPTLTGMLEGNANSEIVSEIMRAFASFKDSALDDIIIPFLKHDDTAVVAYALSTIVKRGDQKGREALAALIKESAVTVEQSTSCDLTTAQAISFYAEYMDDEAVSTLIAFIHHPVASFRKVVINALTSMGDLVLPALEECLEKGDKDEKIMAANIIGWVGHKKGANILNAQFDSGVELETNLRFAIYEALGRIPSVRSIIGLADGLVETDDMVLMAVVIGLNEQTNPGIIKALTEVLDKCDEQSSKVLSSLITGRATRLFSELYKKESHADSLIKAVLASGDQEVVDAFKTILAGIDSDRVEADLAKLADDTGATKSWKVVAADDSKAMLFFYKGAAADMGIELVTFPDGKDALDYFDSAEDIGQIDLLITDMNMPEMDGIELTRKLRALPQWAALPIMMATTETEKEQADLARQAGVNDFISKPFTKDALKEKLTQVLGG